jgi:hypothetical protein
VRVEKPINPDGIPLKVRWSLFPVGASVFIPALDMAQLVRDVNQHAKRRGVTLVWAERIEGGKLGVRFWRTV